MGRTRKVDLRDIRRVLLRTESAKETAAILGISDSCVVRANKTYGWITLRHGCRYGRREPRALVYRCEDCGLNDSVPCRCGITPVWAKEVA